LTDVRITLEDILNELGFPFGECQAICRAPKVMWLTWKINFNADGSKFDFFTSLKPEKEYHITVGKSFDDEIGPKSITSCWIFVSSNKMQNKAEFKENPGKFIIRTREVSGDVMTDTLEVNGKKSIRKLKKITIDFTI